MPGMIEPYFTYEIGPNLMQVLTVFGVSAPACIVLWMVYRVS
jgi:hypothetical protein